MPLHIDRCVSQVERIVCVILVFITHHMGSHTLSSGDSGRELGVGDAEPVFGSRVWMAVYGDCGFADKPVADSGVRNWVVNMTLAWQTSRSWTVGSGVR